MLCVSVSWSAKFKSIGNDTSKGPQQVLNMNIYASKAINMEPGNICISYYYSLFYKGVCIIFKLPECFEAQGG